METKCWFCGKEHGVKEGVGRCQFCEAGIDIPTEEE